MRAVRVQYTVNPEYVETNKKNIKAVMDALASNPIEGMWYRAFLLDDGHTFMHINVCNNEETMGKLNDVAQFKEFRIALKESQPLSPPKSVDIEPVSW